MLFNDTSPVINNLPPTGKSPSCVKLAADKFPNTLKLSATVTLLFNETSPATTNLLFIDASPSNTVIFSTNTFELNDASPSANKRPFNERSSVTIT